MEAYLCEASNINLLLLRVQRKRECEISYSFGVGMVVLRLLVYFLGYKIKLKGSIFGLYFCN